MKKLLKIAIINVVVFASLLFCVNIASLIALKAWRSIERTMAAREAQTTDAAGLDMTDTRDKNRWKLPNYTNKEHAYKIFHDWSNTRSEYRSYIGWSKVPTDKETFTINDEGDRTHPPPPNRTGQEEVARFFGGSTVIGTGVDNTGTIPALFDAMNTEYMAFNHGESSYLSRQSLARLVNAYAMDKPSDLVIFYEGVNDVQSLCQARNSLLGNNRELQIRKLAKTYDISAKEYLIGLDIAFLKFTRKLVQKMRGPESSDANAKASAWYACEDNPDRAEAVADILINNWRSAHALSTARGARFIAVLQPHAFVGSPRLDHIQQEMTHPSRSSMKPQYDAVYPILREKIKSFDYMYDLSDVFDGTTNYYFIDYCHLSRGGNEIVARRINEIVQSLP